MSDVKKPWGGRFREKNHPLFEKMNRSLSFDIRMYKEDIKLNSVYSKELNRIGIINDAELKEILEGLKIVEKEIESGGISVFDNGVEDIHMGVETLLFQKIGDSAKKMHTGKSRNDQVATDIRMYLLKEVEAILALIKAFQTEIVSIAESRIGDPMPGFTHLRQAQPVLFSHYMMSFFFSIQRDYERLCDLKKRISIMPLGSAALAGSAFPLNRENLMKELGFDKMCDNSMDGVSSRDFILEFLSDISILSITLSKFAEDFIIFSSEAYKFFELSDKITTGSSIMPNKKNPDSLELTRGKTGRLIGNMVALFTLLKSLPSTYNKDLQEDKEPLFDTIDTIKEVLEVNLILLQSIEVKTENMLNSIDSLSFATELADYLAKNNLPFREAHHIVGSIVGDCLDKGRLLKDLKESDLEVYCELFKGIGDKWADIISITSKRNLYGGTGVESVKKQIESAKNFIEK